jgi:hypothetical protein
MDSKLVVVAVFVSLEFLAGFEPYSFSRWYGYFFACSWIATYASFSGLDYENSETP